MNRVTSKLQVTIPKVLVDTNLLVYRASTHS